LLQKTDRDGRVTEFEYDNLYRRIEERWIDGESTVRTIGWQYDAAGQVLEVTDPAADYSFVYDGLGRATEITHDLTGLSDDVVFTQEFTANSMRSLLSAVIGTTADFENIFYYDNLSRMVQITQEAQGAGGGYNAVAEKRVNLAYLADGRFDTITRYADLARTDLVAESAYGYDGTGRIDSLDHFKDTTTFAGYTWAYNAANRVTAFTNSEHSAEDSTYGYDDFGQITTADRTGTSNDEGYTYDDNGNRTGGGYSTGAYNRITRDGTCDYEYDDEGNIVLRTRISDDYYTEYEWDHRNRLIGVTDFDDEETQLQQVTYTYDAFNRLVSRTLQIGMGAAETGYFIYDGKNIVLALDDSGDVEQRLLWGPAVDQIFADESIPDGETYWLLDDNLGTVRDVAVYDAGQDATTIANHLFYDAFGRRVSETDDTLSLVDLGYTGRYYDRATALQWNNARWYNASIGRWMSEDWIRDDINTYRYVRNGPTNATDPSGLAPPGFVEMKAADKKFLEQFGYDSYVRGDLDRKYRISNPGSDGGILGMFNSCTTHQKMTFKRILIKKNARTSLGPIESIAWGKWKITDVIPKKPPPHPDQPSEGIIEPFATVKWERKSVSETRLQFTEWDVILEYSVARRTIGVGTQWNIFTGYDYIYTARLKSGTVTTATTAHTDKTQTDAMLDAEKGGYMTKHPDTGKVINSLSGEY
jgi:RHS repeat-associated protein